MTIAPGGQHRPAGGGDVPDGDGRRVDEKVEKSRKTTKKVQASEIKAWEIQKKKMQESPQTQEKNKAKRIKQ